MVDTISVIIPAYEEHEIIDTTLANIFCVLGHDTQVILIDQSAGTKTRQIVTERFPSVIYQTSQGHSRPANMNQGAALATGEMLLFQHADSLLPGGAKEILARLNLRETPFGGFKRRIVPSSLPTRIADRVGNRLLFSHAYFLGDNSLFVKRLLFEELGGFREKPLFEDVQFSARLRQRAKVHGKHWSVISEKVTTSGRKFVKHGPRKVFFLVFLFQTLYFCGFSVHQLERRYRKLG